MPAPAPREQERLEDRREADRGARPRAGAPAPALPAREVVATRPVARRAPPARAAWREIRRARTCCPSTAPLAWGTYAAPSVTIQSRGAAISAPAGRANGRSTTRAAPTWSHASRGPPRGSPAPAPLASTAPLKRRACARIAPRGRPVAAPKSGSAGRRRRHLARKRFRTEARRAPATRTSATTAPAETSSGQRAETDSGTGRTSAADPSRWFSRLRRDRAALSRRAPESTGRPAAQRDRATIPRRG